MKYTVYKTINEVNSKVYIGQHITEDPYDEYLGSGKLIEAAIEKYGRNFFTKKILFIYDNEEEMNTKEAELVTEEFCLREDTYNLSIGGKRNWTYINSSGVPKFKGRKHTEETKQIISGKSKGRKFSQEALDKMSAWQKGKPKPKQAARMLGSKQSEETKRKISESLKKRNKNNAGIVY